MTIERLKVALKYAEKRLDECIEQDNPLDACYWNQECQRLKAKIEKEKENESY